MDIRKGTYKDIEKVADIYEHIHDAEERGDVTIGWIRGIYPTIYTAKAAVEAGDLFVMEEAGNIVAAAKINKIQVDEYALANWRYSDIDSNRIMVLHTLVVDPIYGKKGYGSAFVAYYEKYALDNGCPYLRMDTNEKNVNARRLYAKHGYKEVSIVPCVFNGIPDVGLVCLEKKLQSNI